MGASRRQRRAGAPPAATLIRIVAVATPRARNLPSRLGGTSVNAASKAMTLAPASDALIVQGRCSNQSENPPSTTIVCSVTWGAFDEARKQATSAISSACARRRSAIIRRATLALAPRHVRRRRPAHDQEARVERGAAQAFERGAASDRVVDDVDAVAAGQRLHVVAELSDVGPAVLGARVDHMVGTLLLDH
jgi:hypothetical protein